MSYSFINKEIQEFGGKLNHFQKMKNATNVALD